VLIAESTKNWSQLQEEQAAVRKARVEQRAAELSAKACLPPRMALHEATKAATARTTTATTAAAADDDSKPLLSQSLPPEKVRTSHSTVSFRVYCVFCIPRSHLLRIRVLSTLLHNMLSAATTVSMRYNYTYYVGGAHQMHDHCYCCY
jgi:hypothetical protein